MGGVWGNAIAMGLEAVPVEAHGLLSGILQQGHSLGYLLAAAFTLAFASEGTALDSHKILFWIGAGASFSVCVIQMFFPGSEQFIQAKKEGKRGGHTKAFICEQFFFWCAGGFPWVLTDPATAEAGVVVRTRWELIIYACIYKRFHRYSDSIDSHVELRIPDDGSLQLLLSHHAGLISHLPHLRQGSLTCRFRPRRNLRQSRSHGRRNRDSQSIGRRRAIVIACLCAAAVISGWILPDQIPRPVWLPLPSSYSSWSKALGVSSPFTSTSFRHLSSVPLSQVSLTRLGTSFPPPRSSPSVWRSGPRLVGSRGGATSRLPILLATRASHPLLDLPGPRTSRRPIRAATGGRTRRHL